MRGPVHFVRAMLNTGWDADTLERIDAAPRACLHELHGADHWVHVDAPDELVNLLLSSTPILQES